jgi:hypothetical protein
LPLCWVSPSGHCRTGNKGVAHRRVRLERCCLLPIEIHMLFSTLHEFQSRNGDCGAASP